MNNDESVIPPEDQEPSQIVGQADTTESSALSMLVEADALLRAHGYDTVPQSFLEKAQTGRVRVFEDDYGVVLLQCFDSVDALIDLWEEAQAVLVKALSTNVVSGAARGWEGYIVLMTPALALERDLPALMRIRYDTTRTRKIVITGANRLHRGLAPVLPLLNDFTEASSRDPFDFVVDRLEATGVPSTASRALLDSYRNQRSLFEALETTIGPMPNDEDGQDS